MFATPGTVRRPNKAAVESLLTLANLPGFGRRVPP